MMQRYPVADAGQACARGWNEIERDTWRASAAREVVGPFAGEGVVGALDLREGVRAVVSRRAQGAVCAGGEAGGHRVAPGEAGVHVVAVCAVRAGAHAVGVDVTVVAWRARCAWTVGTGRAGGALALVAEAGEDAVGAWGA